jgi:hypothetical protein
VESDSELIEEVVRRGFDIRNVLGKVMVGKPRPDGTLAPYASGVGNTVAEAARDFVKLQRERGRW